MPAAPPLIRDVAVLVPTLGGPFLEGCLRSIADGSAWPATLVVSQQGRRSEVDRLVRRLRGRGLRVEHVRSDERGPAAARNRGLERVETRFVAATDDDCRVEPDWLERMAASLRREPEALVTGRVVPEIVDGTDGTATSLNASLEPEIHRRPPIDRDPLFGNNMGFALETARRLGPMDERLECAEDAEWSYRALSRRIPVIYDPEAVVRHLAWRDDARLAGRYRRYARGQGTFYGIYLRRGDPFIALRLAFDLARGPWLVVRAAVTRDRELAAIGRAYVTDLAPGVVTGFRGESRAAGP